ncbi:hypothetical protein EC973_000488 [Apophysomyces ossiformis]|uniref:Phosphatidylinositol N-acetylglucosaminyltransferase subunit H conserved domain-containing protein n=1 Tax=Apophysomyces ossiformis TaxID=679940 RepID=A0A8H7BRJ3_9FUNG|nr:hypothetical protein EC973_000488 [Apophysomyces ossiformis]
MPGNHALEYIVKAESSLFPMDALFAVVALLLWIFPDSLCLLDPLFSHSLADSSSVLALAENEDGDSSILVMHGIGIQVKTTYWGGSSVSRFINRLKIEDVVINEGISLWQIKYYMAILVKDQSNVIVVFENLLPKLQPVLLDVYRGTRSIIFPDQGKSVASS